MKTRILTAIALLSALALLLVFYNYKLCLSAIIVCASIIQVEWESLMPRKMVMFRDIANHSNSESTSKSKYQFLQNIVMFIGNLAFTVITLQLSVESFNGIQILSVLLILGCVWFVSMCYALYKPIGSLGNISKQILYRLLPNFTCIAIVFACVIVLNHMWIAHYSFLLFVLPLVWLTDSIAYFIGRKFGRHKLASNISPKKSIEGAVAGVVLSSLIVSFVYFTLKQDISIGLILYFVILSSVSVFGDLFQSRLKREFNIKDSSQLLPGHGGFFDRFDAAIPVLLFSVYAPSFDIWNKINYLQGWI